MLEDPILVIVSLGQLSAWYLFGASCSDSFLYDKVLYYNQCFAQLIGNTYFNLLYFLEIAA